MQQKENIAVCHAQDIYEERWQTKPAQGKKEPGPGVVKISSKPKESESRTRITSRPAVRAPCTVITAWPAAEISGAPGVIKSAGMAMTAVNSGMNMNSLLIKIMKGTLDNSTSAMAINRKWLSGAESPTPVQQRL